MLPMNPVLGCLFSLLCSVCKIDMGIDDAQQFYYTLPIYYSACVAWLSLTYLSSAQQSAALAYTYPVLPRRRHCQLADRFFHQASLLQVLLCTFPSAVVGLFDDIAFNSLFYIKLFLLPLLCLHP